MAPGRALLLTSFTKAVISTVSPPVPALVLLAISSMLVGTLPAGLLTTLSTAVRVTEPVVAVIARTDPNEQESVTLLPELEALVPR